MRRRRKGRAGSRTRHQVSRSSTLGFDWIFGGIVRFLARSGDLSPAIGRLRLFTLARVPSLDRPILAVGLLALAEAAVLPVVAARWR